MLHFINQKYLPLPAEQIFQTGGDIYSYYSDKKKLQK